MDKSYLYVLACLTFIIIVTVYVTYYVIHSIYTQSKAEKYMNYRGFRGGCAGGGYGIGVYKQPINKEQPSPAFNSQPPSGTNCSPVS
jgi:hypothetical protein